MNELNNEISKYHNVLTAMSYRMLGSFVEAQDIVQEVAIEWVKADKTMILSHKSWLIKVCTNKAIDHLKKAYRRREVYTGTWLPEILPDSMITWEDGLDRKESLEVPFLVLLENLSPKERVVYILREVFEYSSLEVSDIINITGANSRKIFQRAKHKMEELRDDYKSNSVNSVNSLNTFFDYACSGSQEDLRSILSPESEFWSDGGGKASAPRHTLFYPDSIARFFASIFKNLNDYKFEYLFVNNKPGLVLSSPKGNELWNLETIFSLEISNGKVLRIYAQRNPDKLTFVSRELSNL